ncbi:MAG: M3 family metallopeptidase, partial [Candidatus Thorarchaeota archaeon]
MQSPNQNGIMTDNGTIRKLDWRINPSNVQAISDDVITEAKKKLDIITKIPEGDESLDTLQSFEEILAAAHEIHSHLTFLKYVSNDKAQRDVCHKVEQDAEKFKNEVWSRNDIYKVIARLESNIDSLEGEEKLLLEKTLEEFRHRGAALEDDTRMEFLEISNNISVLESDFNRVLNEITKKVPCTKEELVGVPEEIYESLEKDGDAYLLPLDNPVYYPVIQYGKNPETRNRMFMAYYRRGGKENSERLEDALALRDRQAKLLKHSNYAEYEISRKMAKTPKRVHEFMNDLKDKLTPLSKKEFEVLRGLKAQEQDKSIDDTELELWDFWYYHELLLKEKYAVDQNEVKKYFPMETVVDGVLDVYQKVLNLEFRESDTPNIWYEDVREFSVYDKVTGKLMGIFYLDLYPREGKFKHYAVFPILERRLKDGECLLPITAMVTNFQKPTQKQPSLLTHPEVITFFHEFGHLMHVITNKTNYARFGLDGVLPDFIEVPSQMLENWSWKEEVLSLISGHYEDSKQKLPSDLLKRMIEAKLLNVGMFQIRQVFLSLIDLLYHTEGSEDTSGDFIKLYHNVTGFKLPDDITPDAGFGHLMGGYSAGYYSYLWSKVYAEDLFTK